MPFLLFLTKIHCFWPLFDTTVTPLFISEKSVQNPYPIPEGGVKTWFSSKTMKNSDFRHFPLKCHRETWDLRKWPFCRKNHTFSTKLTKMCQKTPRTFAPPLTAPPIDTENPDFHWFSVIFTVFRGSSGASGVTVSTVESQWGYSGHSGDYSGETVQKGCPDPYHGGGTMDRTVPVPPLPGYHAPPTTPCYTTPCSRGVTVRVHQASFGYNRKVKTRKLIVFAFWLKWLNFRIFHSFD